MPETTYTHKPLHGPGRLGEKKDDTSSQKSGEKTEIEAREDQPLTPRKKSYLEELRVYNGIRPTRASVITLLIRPFIVCLTPVCLWAGLVYGIAITWLVLIATSVSQLFTAARESSYRHADVSRLTQPIFPAYNFDTADVGLTYSK